MKSVFLFLSLFLLCVFLGNAQETIIKHTVSKGETVFQLAKKYNVSPNDIYALNPSAVDVIKIGEVLSIPQSRSNSTPTTSSSNSKTNTITYAVVYGDTKYSLARRFGISVEEIERQNPHTRNELQAGHILKIERQSSNTVVSNNFTIKKKHLVLKGQTLWGISYENGLTVEQLVNANSDNLNGILQIGQVLNIPNISVDNSFNSETYLVQRGETKYGLSKKYGVSITELENANPQIVRMLMAGHTIQIPKDTSIVENKITKDVKPVETEKVSTNNQEPKKEATNEEVMAGANSKIENEANLTTESNTLAYTNYEVQPKETLYGLSKKAGMSISDFVSLNPQLLNGVKIGAVVKMPTSQANQTQGTTTIQPTTNQSAQRYADLSQSINSMKKNQVLLLLPFSEAEYDNEYAQYLNFSQESDEFLKYHLEFYRGVKIAKDSAKAMGLDFDLKIVETNNSKRNTKAVAIAKENNIQNYDAIVAPFYENDTEAIASLVQDKNIPVVTTNTISETKGLNNLFNGVPNLNTKRSVILDYINSKGGNLIVVMDIARAESKTFISNYAPKAIFVEVNKKGVFDADELVSQLDKRKMNYIVLESDKNSVFLSATNLLLGQLTNYSIQLALLDKSLIPSTDDVSNKRFVILQMLFPSLTPINESKMTNDFIRSYNKRYEINPSDNVKFGFDLTFDTLLRIAQEISFEESIKKNITEYTSLKFNYKINEKGSYNNQGIYIMQYNTDATLKEVK